MNKSGIFRTAHTTAKATRNNFTTYRAAFSAALKSAYSTPAVDTIETLSAMTFEAVADANARIGGILKFFGKTPERRGRRNFNIFSDLEKGIDYHVSYGVNRNGSITPSFRDVTDKI